MDEILDLLRQNARLSVEDIAAMTKKSSDEVNAIIKKLEDDGIILKYATIVDNEKTGEANNIV
ncbi:MAG: Lrp/AsnC family transcriptional regulator, partial [Treponemataceae bacterium]|nr:Lrp/AsnC family transcriptional regulator [Treponemataceae bacterium]